MSVSYHADYTPTDIEGGVDTNSLPWTPLELAIGMSIKLLQASLEPGTSLQRLMFGADRQREPD